MFQLALPAHELGELEGLYCSVVDGQGKWGRRLGRLAPAGTVRPLGWEGLPQGKLLEYSWPLLLNRMLKRFLPLRSTEHRRSNVWFDRAAARWLRGLEGIVPGLAWVADSVYADVTKKG